MTTATQPTLAQIADQMESVLMGYFEQLGCQGDRMTLDGTLCVGPRAEFVDGSVVKTGAFLLGRLDPSAPAFAGLLNTLRTFIAASSGRALRTWNILFYVEGLLRLSQLRLLDPLVASSELALLRQSLDWRSFVDPRTLTLGTYPTNYLGVAYRIALLREEFAWDDAGTAQPLLDRLLEHFIAYSDGGAYMDETDGDGRFDIYTLAMPAELCAALAAAGRPISDQLLHLLRRAADIYLRLANLRGDGFSYGRSIGFYGDRGAFMLTLAAELGLLTADEQALSFAYHVKIARKLHAFWFDRGMNAFNLWEHGRRADSYRHKGRIFGVNLEAMTGLISLRERWDRLGYREAAPDAHYRRLLAHLPRHSYVPFATQRFDRGLLIVRDGDDVMSLPLVNVADFASQDIAPYLPIPNLNRVLETPPSSSFAQLTPFFRTPNGRLLAAIGFAGQVCSASDGAEVTLEFEQLRPAVIGPALTLADDVGLGSRTSYSFRSRLIERTDLLVPELPIELSEIVLEFATFSTNPTVDGSTLRFADGPIAQIEVQGLPLERIDDIQSDASFHTSHGPLCTRAVWAVRDTVLDRPLRLSWRLQLR